MPLPGKGTMSGISLGRVTAILVVGRGVGFVLALGNAVILARALGVNRLGAYAYAMGIAGLFGLLPNFGISTIVTRTIARDPEAAGGVLKAAQRAQAVLAGGVFLVIITFAAILPGQPVPLGYVALAAAQLAIGTLSWPFLAVLGGSARYDRLAVAELAAGAAGTLLMLLAAVSEGGVAAFLWAHVLAAVVAVLVARRAAVPLLPQGRALAIRQAALLREAGPLGATAAVSSLYTRLDILLLGQMASTGVLGLYSAAYKPINLAVSFGNTMGGTLLPLMAREPQSGVPVAFERAVRGLGIAGPALALALSGLGGPLLRLAFGADFAAAAPVLTLLAWSMTANWLYAPLSVALQARGRERWWLASLSGGLALNLAGNVWAIPRWGAVGAAGATLVSETALLSLAVLLLYRQLGIRPSLRPVLAALGATAAGGGALVVLWSAGPLAATAAALAVYGSLAALWRLVTGKDVAMVAGWLREATAGWSRA